MPHHPENPSKLKPVPVWDVPVRLFHWSLVALVITLWLTSQSKWLYNIDIHFYCGYAVLILLIFRILWGFFGSKYARFEDFVCGIPTALNYATGLFKPPAIRCVGHNPLGSWSVILLLGVLLVEVVTGLFASDDIITDGPLRKWVVYETSRFLTTVHRLGFNWVLLTLIVLHLSAIFFYLLVKRENLVRPMITGWKWLPLETPVTPFVSPWRAVLLLGLAAGSVYLLVFIV